MRQKSVETYENLVRYYNRNVSVQETCECGKILPKHKMEGHRKTGIHKLLMSYKEQCQKLLDDESETIPSPEPVAAPEQQPAAPEPEKKTKRKYKLQSDNFVRDPAATTATPRR